MTFNNFNVDKEIEYAWSRFKKNNFVFSSENTGNDIFYLESATEFTKSGGGCSPSYGSMNFRRHLLEDFSM